MGVALQFVILLVLCAAPLLGQATSQRRIPVTKGAPPPKPPHVDTVRIVVHDTVVVHTTDTLSVFQAAALPATPAPTQPEAEKSCSDRYIPIPIPIPFPRGHSNGGENGGGGGGIIGGTTATPEPATWLLMGTGLATTLGIARTKRVRARRREEEALAADSPDEREIES